MLIEKMKLVIGLKDNSNLKWRDYETEEKGNNYWYWNNGVIV